jgi:hypothetical protein
VESGWPKGTALEQVLDRRIAQRTWGRLQFRVPLKSGRVVIQCSSATNCLKQLALEAVWEVLPSTLLELEIRVAKAGPCPDTVTRRRCSSPGSDSPNE